jgi:hypothetical protein
METNKENQVSIISEEGIQKALKAFKESYEVCKEKYKKANINEKDVISLTKSFSGKNSFLATNVIISVMIAMPPRDFMALMETARALSKAKLLEAMKEILNGAKDADNSIIN